MPKIITGIVKYILKKYILYKVLFIALQNQIMEAKDIRKQISEYMINHGIMRSHLAKKIKRSPTLVTMILDCNMKLTESNLLKINEALFEEEKEKYFK